MMGKSQFRQAFISLLESVDKIVLHEDYAGLGTCGWALLQQFNAMKMAVCTELSERALDRGPFVSRFHLRCSDAPCRAGYGI